MASMTQTSSSIDELNLLIENTNDKEPLLEILIRCVMRTFYTIPSSLVCEYIYQYKCINLNDLASRLCLNPKQIQSYIQEFKRSKFIIEEHRRESNSDSKHRFDPKTLYYKIDIETLINVVKYRLIKMQLEIEDFERKESSEKMLYKCKQCLEKYSESDIAKLFKINLDDDEEDLACMRCQGIVCENDQTEEESIRCSIRLFNQQMTPLFKILKKIDEIMKNETSTVMINLNIKVIINKNDDDDTNVKIVKSKDKPLPEWFTHSTIFPESD